MREKWMLRTKKADFNEIGRKFKVDPLIARLIRNRDIVLEEDIKKYLYGNKEDMYSPYLLKDMEKAVSILEEKIKNQSKIRIVSDYDVDGVISNYVLYRGLQEIGADVDYEIPDRINDGYGINERMVMKAVEDGIDTILTCDNGIAAVNQIALAKEKGLFLFEAITTAHHPHYGYIKENLPKLGRLKVVNANFCQFSSRYPALLSGKPTPVLDHAFAGGALMDINLYNIHFVVGLFGAPKSVRYFPNRHETGVDTSM